MTWRILKLSSVAAIAAVLLIGSLPAGAESRPAAKAPREQAKSPPVTAKSPPPAPEPATKADKSPALCLGRLIDIVRQRSAA